MGLPQSLPEYVERLKLQELEHKLGYCFSGHQHLIEALTHSSFLHENRDKTAVHNERLEFLGDSVLGLIVVEYLYRCREKHDESVLSKIKSFVVSETVLADCACEINLGVHMLFGKGEEMSGGREKPSILSSGLEAIIGAIYIDGGFEETKRVVGFLLNERIDSAMRTGKFQDYKTELQEKSQALFGMLPEYRLLKEQGAEHKRIFTVAVYIGEKEMGMGKGKRKKEAETNAARKALESLA